MKYIIPAFLLMMLCNSLYTMENQEQAQNEQLSHFLNLPYELQRLILLSSDQNLYETIKDLISLASTNNTLRELILNDHFLIDELSKKYKADKDEIAILLGSRNECYHSKSFRGSIMDRVRMARVCIPESVMVKSKKEYFEWFANNTTMLERERFIRECIQQNNICALMCALKLNINTDDDSIGYHDCKAFFKSQITHNDLICAIEQNYSKDIIELIILHGVNKYNMDINAIYNSPRGSICQNALQEAAKRGNIEIANLLLKNGADINTPCKLGRTALHFAVEQGHCSMVRSLIEAGADVSISDTGSYRGHTPLLYAVQGHEEIVAILISARADVNAKTTDGKTALILAAQLGHKDIVRMLLDAGADVNVIDDSGLTILQLTRNIARFPVGKEIVQMLKEAGAK